MADPHTLIYPANCTDDLIEIFIPMIFEAPEATDYILACLKAPWRFNVIELNMRTAQGTAGLQLWVNDLTRVTFTAGANGQIISSNYVAAAGPTAVYTATANNGVGVDQNLKLIVEEIISTTSPVLNLEAQLLIRREKPIITRQTA
jgi:hypothetical protein